MISLLSLIGIAATIVLPHAAGDQAVGDQTESIEFFERKIRPVLVERCYECHSAESELVQGGFRVDDGSAMMRGGESGTAIVPGNPDSSLLLSALRYGDVQMPPDERLPDEVIRDFETWIRSGAVMPTDHAGSTPQSGFDPAPIDWQQAKQFWAFMPPVRHDPDKIQPSPRDPQWALTKLDRFIQARLDQAGLSPNPMAGKAVWLRRVTFDLIGLPPTREQLDAFMADRSPLAKQHVVDRLLGSPQHAERWARMWLDIARYAEDQAHIVGDNDTLTYPNAYLYREWVIDAFASDLPYDQFIRQQLAADLIRPEDTAQHVALGFIGLGPKYYRRNDIEVMADEWEDRVDTVSRGLLGLTVACARCHDHKFDPLPTADYYALAGVFASTEMFNRPLRDDVEISNGQAKKPQDALHIVREGKIQDLNVMIRGDAKRLGPTVKRGFLTVLANQDASPSPPDRADTFASGSGRLGLADAIIDRTNPLTARVIVNRIWQQMMGSPLVDTPSNFGHLGSRPTHPLLLDDLAVRFMEADWSIKWLQREIALSAVYGQSSAVDVAKSEIDPQNRLLWRMPRRRLSLEAYRDAILVASDSLDATLGGTSIDPEDTAGNRRTVYSKVSRLDLNPMLARFDFPDPNAHSPRRHETTTPLQKLFLLNSPFLVQHAAKLSQRIQTAGSTDRQRIDFAYQLLYGRSADETEHRLAQAFVNDGDHNDGDHASRWNDLAQVLLISNEMFMVD